MVQMMMVQIMIVQTWIAESQALHRYTREPVPPRLRDEPRWKRFPPGA
jgi:hypothetical protein